MNGYSLNNYSMSFGEKLQSLFVSEYGLRHLKQSVDNPLKKWGHRIIGVIELIPILGPIVSLIEGAVASIFGRFSRPQPKPQVDLTNKTVKVEKKPKFKLADYKVLNPYNADQILFNSSQIFCNGEVDEKLRDGVFNLLLLHPNKPSSVTFDPLKKKKSIQGGNCSAMSLYFLQEYFSSSWVHPLDKIMGLDTSFQLNTMIASKAAHQLTAFRSHQQAMNCIVRDTKHPTSDFEKDKIQALLNIINCQVIDSTSTIEIQLEHQKKGMADLKQELDKLGCGVFFVRQLELPKTPQGDAKGEESGHSMIFIKTPNSGFFYDPNNGVAMLSKENDIGEIYFQLQKNHTLFDTSRVRFYKIDLNSSGATKSVA